MPGTSSTTSRRCTTSWTAPRGDKELKAWVKEHLECLMPGCPDRRLTAVNRSQSRRRDGFTHRQGAGKHGIEGFAGPGSG
jgi:hypothetical protein